METIKTFRVDKKLVFKSFLPFQGFTILVLLFFLNGITKINETIYSSEFWLWVMGIVVIGFILNLWTILYERIEIRGTIITSYFNSKTSADILDFASVKQKKTAYTNYLGFDYKEPKGIFVRYLLPYGSYNPKTLQDIMHEILRINSNIKLEDDLSQQIVNGTYKSKVIDVG